MGKTKVDWKNDPNYGKNVKATPGYDKLIKEATGCQEEEIGGIEQLMRDFHGTLDGLSSARFRRDAKAAMKELRAMWSHETNSITTALTCALSRKS